VTSLFRSALPCFLLGLLLATSAAQAAEAPEQPAPDSTAPEGPVSPLTSLYPLWENTAHLLGHQELYLGTSNAEFGILDVAQLGTHPLSFIFRTPNIHGKVRLLSRERLAVAAHAELLVFLPGASEAFISSNYISRLDTRDILLTVIPVGATATYQLTPWLYLHGTATVMGIFDDGPYRNRLVPGVTVVAEFLALQHHTFRAHTGEVGFWNHDFNILGASYCYRRKWFEAQVGYVLRFMRDGRQGNPLISLGAYL
jgi:hypothetical protein